MLSQLQHVQKTLWWLVFHSLSLMNSGICIWVHLQPNIQHARNIFTMLCQQPLHREGQVFGSWNGTEGLIGNDERSLVCLPQAGLEKIYTNTIRLHTTTHSYEPCKVHLRKICAILSSVKDKSKVKGWGRSEWAAERGINKDHTSGFEWEWVREWWSGKIKDTGVSSQSGLWCKLLTARSVIVTGQS